MMHLMGKDFQDLDAIYGAADKLTQAGIRPSFNLIFGYPGEGEKERRESVALMMNICRRYPGAEFWTNIFTPYPGSPIMKRAFELGIEVPKTLEGWADFFPRYTVLPWLKGREHERLQNMREYMRVAFHRVPIGKYRTPALNRLLFEMISLPARWRLDHHVYSFPVELWARKSAQKTLDAAQAQGGRPPALGRTGDLLRGQRHGRRPSHPFQPPLLRPQAGAQDAAVSAAADPARGGVSAPRGIRSGAVRSGARSSRRKASSRRWRAIGRAWWRCAKTISIS